MQGRIAAFGAHFSRGVMPLLFLLAGSTACAAETISPADQWLIDMAIIGIIFVILYLIPTYVAFARRHPNRWFIFVINVVFGGTGLGWLGSLIWAMGAINRAPDGTPNDRSGFDMIENDQQRLPETLQVAKQVDGHDWMQQLERVRSLFDAGTISESEYLEIKRSILTQKRLLA